MTVKTIGDLLVGTYFLANDLKADKYVPLEEAARYWPTNARFIIWPHDEWPEFWLMLSETDAHLEFVIATGAGLRQRFGEG